jgi:Zn-finger nucleic acid-binding protein
MQCPKCRGTMRTYNRSGVQIEQCDNCRGIFLDYGELEALTRLESQWGGGAVPPAPPPAHGQPAWGAPAHYGHGHGHGHRSFGRVLFSS